MASEQDAALAIAVRALAMGARVLERSLDDMTLAQFRVLGLIASSPERASRLAERAAVSRPSLTGLLDGLEARGWVERHDVAGDRRGVNLQLTRAGASAFRHAEKAMATELDGVLGDDRAAVLDGLSALSRVLKERARARS